MYIYNWETSLVVQWLRLCASNAAGADWIPGGELRSHMPCHGAYVYIYKYTWNQYFCNILQFNKQEGKPLGIEWIIFHECW